MLKRTFCIMFGQLSNRESLLNVGVVLEVHHTKCYHLGMEQNPIAKTTFASADLKDLQRMYLPIQ